MRSLSQSFWTVWICVPLGNKSVKTCTRSKDYITRQFRTVGGTLIGSLRGSENDSAMTETVSNYGSLCAVVWTMKRQRNPKRVTGAYGKHWIVTGKKTYWRRRVLKIDNTGDYCPWLMTNGGRSNWCRQQARMTVVPSGDRSSRTDIEVGDQQPVSPMRSSRQVVGCGWDFRLAIARGKRWERSEGTKPSMVGGDRWERSVTNGWKYDPSVAGLMWFA